MRVAGWLSGFEPSHIGCGLRGKPPCPALLAALWVASRVAVPALQDTKSSALGKRFLLSAPPPATRKARDRHTYFASVCVLL